jgi:Protein of unknown function (DUF2961)
MKIAKFILALISLAFICPLHAQELYQMPAATQSRVSSFENLNGEKGKGGLTNNGAKGNAFESLRSGESKTLLNIHSAGVIRRIWCTVDDRSPAMLRSLRLRMYWDSASKPAVDVPLGDFFCAGLGIPVAFQSALFANPEGRSFNCYIPMPFKKAARVLITNEGKKDLGLLFFDIDFTTAASEPKDMLYFHACWNRSRKSELGKDFVLMPVVHGQGRFLGVNIGINVNTAYPYTWWGEGEVKMFLDGDRDHPTINGTGTEDYAGTGWGLGAFAQQYSGCTVADDKNNRYTFYRFHIPDPIYFQKDFRATIQEIGGGEAKLVKGLQEKGAHLIPVTMSGDHFMRLMEKSSRPLDSAALKGWMNFYRTDDYSATAYFYLDSPTSDLKGLAPIGERIP